VAFSMHARISAYTRNALRQAPASLFKERTQGTPKDCRMTRSNGCPEGLAGRGVMQLDLLPVVPIVRHRPEGASYGAGIAECAKL
jgi:hypothetical protein